MLIELLVGFQYTWGIFDRALQESHAFAATETRAVLGAQVILYSVTFFAAGWVLHRFGPRVTTLIGGVLYGSSLVIGGTFGQNPPALFWGARVLFGAGPAALFSGQACPRILCTCAVDGGREGFEFFGEIAHASMDSAAMRSASSSPRTSAACSPRAAAKYPACTSASLIAPAAFSISVRATAWTRTSARYRLPNR